MKHYLNLLFKVIILPFVGLGYLIAVIVGAIYIGWIYGIDYMEKQFIR